MQIKSLLLGLGILGSSTVALADHDVGYQARSRVYDGRPRAIVRDGFADRARILDRDRLEARRYDRYDRYADDRFSQPRTTWLALTDVQRLDRGGDVFDVRSRERFAQLRLQNQTGRTLVRQIEVVFTDGSRRCVNVDRVLDGNHAMVNIDLERDGRRIAQVIVDGRSLRGGSYQLYAM